MNGPNRAQQMNGTNRAQQMNGPNRAQMNPLEWAQQGPTNEWAQQGPTNEWAHATEFQNYFLSPRSTKYRACTQKVLRGGPEVKTGTGQRH